MEEEKNNELMINDYLKINPDGMSPMDMTVMEEVTRPSWVIQPLIFARNGDPVRSSLLSSINIEMIGDSNAETLSAGAFTNPTVSIEDQRKLLNSLEFQQLHLIADTITNNIKEMAIINFSNFYKQVFGNDIIIRNIDPEIYFSSKLVEDNWIKHNVFNYVNMFVDFNTKYNLMKDIGVHNRDNSSGDVLPEGSWKDYTDQFSISISQYIGNLITEALYRCIRYGVYHESDRALNKLANASVIVEKVNEGDIPIDKDFFLYNYITKYISSFLYKLVAESINGSVYRILCNVPCMYSSMFHDMTRFYLENYPEKEN